MGGSKSSSRMKKLPSHETAFTKTYLLGCRNSRCPFREHCYYARPDALCTGCIDRRKRALEASVEAAPVIEKMRREQQQAHDKKNWEKAVKAQHETFKSQKHLERDDTQQGPYQGNVWFGGPNTVPPKSSSVSAAESSTSVLSDDTVRGYSCEGSRASCETGFTSIEVIFAPRSSRTKTVPSPQDTTMARKTTQPSGVGRQAAPQPPVSRKPLEATRPVARPEPARIRQHPEQPIPAICLEPTPNTEKRNRLSSNTQVGVDDLCSHLSTSFDISQPMPGMPKPPPKIYRPEDHRQLPSQRHLLAPTFGAGYTPRKTTPAAGVATQGREAVSNRRKTSKDPDVFSSSRDFFTSAYSTAAHFNSAIHSQRRIGAGGEHTGEFEPYLHNSSAYGAQTRIVRD